MRIDKLYAVKERMWNLLCSYDLSSVLKESSYLGMLVFRMQPDWYRHLVREKGCDVYRMTYWRPTKHSESEESPDEIHVLACGPKRTTMVVFRSCSNMLLIQSMECLSNDWRTDGLKDVPLETFESFIECGNIFQASSYN